MATRRRQQFVHGQIALMVGAALVLSALGALTLELFYVVSLVGFLVLVELTAPFTVEPYWRTRLAWLAVLGLLGFGYIMVDRVLDFLPSGVF